jgi:DNA-binding transcriptional LysR family regulator
MKDDLAWDDLRFVLAVAREGTLSGAARRLGVRHSTVFRRLSAIERKLGARLFDRFRDGYVATPAGESAATLAARLAEDVLSLERHLTGQDLRPAGTVRVATTDTVATLLMPHVAALRSAQPEIFVEIVISNTMANLTRREADIAVRPTADPSEILVGRRVAGLAHAIYGSRRYLAARRGKDAKSHAWIGLDDSLAGTVIGRWMNDNVPAAQIACRVDALPTLRDAVCASMGLAVLPCYVGDVTAGLIRPFGKTLSEVNSALWLLTHNDIRRTARVRAVMDFLATALSRQRALLEGKQGA